MFFLTIPLFKLITKIKILSILSLITLVLNYLLLSKVSLILLAFLNAIHLSSYWAIRYIYITNISKVKNISKETNKFMILVQISTMLSPIFSSILLKYSYLLLLIVSCSIYLFSLFFLLKVKIILPKLKFSLPHNLNKIYKPLYFFDQLKLLITYFLPLYLYIFTFNSIQIIANLNLIIGISSLISLFIFNKKLNIKILMIILSTVWFFKLFNLNLIIISILCIIEGFILKPYELNTLSKLFKTSYKYNSFSYFILMELYINFIRVIILLILYILNVSLFSIILILNFLFLSSLVVNNKDKT